MAGLRVWKADERVTVTFAGRTVDATIELASFNGHSLALRFEALLGGYAGLMPVLWRGFTRGFVDLIHEEPVVIAERPEKAVQP